jgi:hypothetical protein
MVRKLITALSALALALVTVVMVSSSPASAATCFASHYNSNQPWLDQDVVVYNGHVSCSSSVTFTFTSTLTKNGTIVDTDSGTHTGTGITTSAIASNPSGSQYWCGKTKVTWSGGSSTTGSTCRYF